MKFACASSAFDQPLRSGALTQLEWIDLSAHQVAADGIVFDVRHFPRTDGEYLAQIKKMAVDLGLSVAAFRHDRFFDNDESHMRWSFEIALALGAPILAAPLPSELAMSWTQLQERLAQATALAKALNVTLAIRNVAQSFAASGHDMKRVSKEADSAWLRYGPDFSALEAGSDAAALLRKTVLVWHSAGNELAEAAQQIVRLLAGFRGFVALDDAEGGATPERLRAEIAAWRKADRT